MAKNKDLLDMFLRRIQARLTKRVCKEAEARENSAVRKERADGITVEWESQYLLVSLVQLRSLGR